MEELSIPKYSNGDIALPNVSRTRRESMKCENCAVKRKLSKKHPYRLRTMKRLYVRERNQPKPIGWYCKRCGSVVLDELIRSAHLAIPTPVVKIGRIRIR